MYKFRKEEMEKNKILSELIKRQWDSDKEKNGSLLKTNIKIRNRSEKKPKKLIRLHGQIKKYV